MDELYDQTISLKSIQKDFVDHVETELHEASSLANRVEIMNQFLWLLLTKNGRLDEQPRLTESLTHIDQSMGMVDITHWPERPVRVVNNMIGFSKPMSGFHPNGFYEFSASSMPSSKKTD